MELDYLNKAKENINAAQICFDNCLYNACANRMYYALLQAVFVALKSRGIDRGKIDHKRVQADFAEKLIKRQKVYPTQYKSYLSSMQLIRNKADYLQDSITQKVANRWLYRAKDLIELIERKVKDD